MIVLFLLQVTTESLDTHSEGSGIDDNNNKIYLYYDTISNNTLNAIELTSSPGGCRHTHLAACRFMPTSDF